MSNENAISIGIDLGTTYSSIAYYIPNGTQPELITRNGGMNAFSSSILLGKTVEGEGTFYFGEKAKNSSSPFVLYDSKRLIGKTYYEYQQMGDEKNKWPFEVIDKEGLVQMVISNPLNKSQKESFYPEEVSALILTGLIDLAREKFGEKQIGNIVVTIPVDFDMAQRKATIRACQLAGIENVELLNEPSASIIEYNRNYPMNIGSRVLVIDFGGGTLDCCLCEIQQRKNNSINSSPKVKVIQTIGDQNLGGNDFDRIIENMLIDKMRNEGIDETKLNNFFLQENENISTRTRKAKALKKLKTLAEHIKRELLAQQTIYVTNEQLSEVLGFDDEYEEICFTRKEFEMECMKSGIIERFKNVIQQLMKESKLNETQLDLILPIGGSCSIPLIRQIINSLFPHVPLGDRRYDPTTAVAKGAATRAYEIYNTTEGDEEGFEEVLAHSYGIELADFDIEYFA